MILSQGFFIHPSSALRHPRPCRMAPASVLFVSAAPLRKLCSNKLPHIQITQVRPLQARTKPAHATISPPTPPAAAAFDALYDVSVIGAGPAGLSLAAALSTRGLRVALLDPVLDRAWPNHYGVWEDEFSSVGLSDCATARYARTCVFSGGEKIVLDRPYIRVDRVKLKARLMERCAGAGVTFINRKVTDVRHVSQSFSHVVTDGGEGGEVRTRLAMDCTGHALMFAEERRDGVKKACLQAAYGIEAEVKEHPFDNEEMLLMDFRDNHMTGSDKVRSNERPTFLYVFPVGNRQAFFEETSVIAPEAVGFEELKERLYKRLEGLNVVVERVIEEEYSLIPMGGSLPARGRVVGFGGGAGMVHPATGYMVGRTMQLAEDVAQQVCNLLTDAGTEGDMANVAQHVWRATWNADRLRQRDFLVFGAELLANLDMSESEAFFTAFFALPDALWKQFLAYRLDSAASRAAFALRFFAVADWNIRARLLRGIVDIGKWPLIRSVLPNWIGDKPMQ